MRRRVGIFYDELDQQFRHSAFNVTGGQDQEKGRGGSNWKK